MDKGPCGQSSGSSSSHVWMLESDHKESWALKNWCFRAVVLLKTFKSPLDSKEINPVYPKGNQLWIFVGRTAGETEAPVLWPLDGKNQLTGKDLDTGKGWRQEKGTAGDEMIIWHHQLNGHEFEHVTNSRRWWRTGKPGVQSIGWQRVRHDWDGEAE